MQRPTTDGVDHGECKIEACIWAMIERFEDGYVLCPITWSGGSCEECMEILNNTDEW